MTPKDINSPATSAASPPGTQPRCWWVPLVMIAVTIVLLGAVPLAASSRVADLRSHASEITSPALVLVNDLEASLAAVALGTVNDLLDVSRAEAGEQRFEEFFRVPGTNAAVPGTGVRLATGRHVARLLGGDLRLRGTAGGATFTLRLPMRNE